MEVIDLQMSTHLELHYEKSDPDIPEWFFFQSYLTLIANRNNQEEFEWNQ